MVEAVVEFEYVAEQADELSLTVGEIVKNIIQSEGGWWEGEINDRKGMFPENFVKIIKAEDKLKKEPEVGTPIKKSAAQRKSVRELASKFKDSNVHLGPMPPPKKKDKKKKCKVVFDYAVENEDELELHIGEIIDFNREVEDGWWEGTLNGKTGVFPSNFCEMVEEAEEPPVAAVKPVTTSTDDAEEPAPEHVTEIKGKKVMGVGLGNIFDGGPIKLRKTKGEPKPKPEKPTEVKEIGKPVELAPPVPSVPVPQPPASHSPPAEPEVVKRETKDKGDKAVVRFSYVAEQPDELSLETGQVVNILDMKLEDDGWWKGEFGGKIGVFPDNFVELIVEETKPKRPLPPVNTTTKPAPIPSHKPVNTKGGLYPKLPDKVPAAPTESKKHDVKHEPKHEIKHEIKHEPKHEIKHEPKHEVKPEPTHVNKKESSEFVSTNPITSKKAGPPPVSKKPPLVKPESTKRSSDSRSESKDGLSSKDSKTKETKHLEKNTVKDLKEDRLEDDSLVDTDEDLDNLETTGSTLIHLTVTRPKAPKKRPPSSFIPRTDAEIVSPEDRPTPNIHDLTPHINYNKHETEKAPPVHHAKQKDTRHVVHGENEKKTVTYEQTNHAPPRPPEPTPAAAVGDHANNALEDLQKEFRQMQASMVTKSDYTELKSLCDNLKSELDTVKATYSKKIRELMMEVDEEKKLRLATQVEIERIKKLLAESHV